MSYPDLCSLLKLVDNNYRLCYIQVRVYYMSSLKRIEQLNILARAKYPLIYIISWEERRIEEMLRQVAGERRKQLYLWTLTNGIVPVDLPHDASVDTSTRNPLAALDYISLSQESALFVLKDFHPFLEPRGGMEQHVIVRKIRDVLNQLKESRKTLVILSPVLQFPPELEKDITVLDYSLPNLDELAQSLDRVVRSAREISGMKIALNIREREMVLNAARGLTCTEAENVFAKSLVMTHQLDVDVIIREKEQLIRRSQILEYFQSVDDFSNVGGMGLLKQWLRKRGTAFSEQARSFGLPEPKGLLLLGVQGAGKSLLAKAVASQWHLPLLRLDLGRVFSELVGSSENNIRSALRLAESVAPCIAGDTQIVLADGSECTIESLYQRTSEEALSVLGMTQQFTLEPVKVKAITRRPAPDLYRIRFLHNHLRATSNHLHPVMKNGCLVWVRTDELKIGDYVAMPRQIPTKRVLPRMIEFLPLETRLYHQQALSFASPDVQTSQRRYAARVRRSNYVRINELASAEIHPGFEQVEKFVIGRGGTTDSTLLKLPATLNVEIGYLLGLITSDGYLGKRRIGFVNTELALHEIFTHIIKTQFGLTPSRRLMESPKKNTSLNGTNAYSQFQPCYASYVDSLLLCQILGHIQAQLLRLPHVVINAWLRGYFDGDGYIAEGNAASPKIILVSKVPEINRQVRAAMHRVGFPTTNPGVANIEITGFANVLRFIKQIGSSHPKKQARMEIWQGQSPTTPKDRTDVIPIGQRLRQARQQLGLGMQHFKHTSTALISNYERGNIHPSRSRLRSIVQEMRTWATEHSLESDKLSSVEELLDTPIGWSPVLSIQPEAAPDYVYDLACEAPHTFIANGTVTHNCVLWIDEIEKGLGGVASSHASDAGTTARVFASILTWMQEKTSPVFVIATANDISKLPPEMLRKGRFDEIFFVDLPVPQERREIFAIHLARRGRDPLVFDLTKLAMATHGFSGAEIEQVVISGLYDAFETSRDLTTQDLLKNIQETVPLSQTMEAEISQLRRWGKTHARPASLPEQPQPVGNGRSTTEYVDAS